MIDKGCSKITERILDTLCCKNAVAIVVLPEKVGLASSPMLNTVTDAVCRIKTVVTTDHKSKKERIV